MRVLQPVLMQDPQARSRLQRSLQARPAGVNNILYITVVIFLHILLLIDFLSTKIFKCPY